MYVKGHRWYGVNQFCIENILKTIYKNFKNKIVFFKIFINIVLKIL
jgi:hypothetical protein